MADDRPWITCHVLDTVAGKPAAGIQVTLSFDFEGKVVQLSATTNSDGRVTGWTSDSTSQTQALNEYVDKVRRELGPEHLYSFEMTFFTEQYWSSGSSFYPYVKIPFLAKLGEGHYHVPLLMSPWSYTTYRGS